MSAANKTPQSGAKCDPLTGYMFSVVLALLISRPAGYFLYSQIADIFRTPLAEAWSSYFATAFFVATVAASPARVWLVRAPVSAALIRFGAGFGAGIVLQKYLIAPVAGQTTATFILLLLAAMIMPFLVTFDRCRACVQGRRSALREDILNVILKMVNIPNRVVFVVLMAFAFLGFLTFVHTLLATALVIVAMLAIVTTVVALRHSEHDKKSAQSELERWKELDEAREIKASTGLRILVRLRNIGLGLLPGAVLFAGMIRLSIVFLGVVYPNMAVAFGSLTGMAILVVSGLAVVFFGMMAALGFALVAMRIIGYARNWTPAHIRENYARLVRMLYFRPMKGQ